jgi:hypothetical protein
MNVSCWIYPAVACISLSIGTSQTDPRPTMSAGGHRSAKRWKESPSHRHRVPQTRFGDPAQSSYGIPAAIGKVTLSAWLLELWQLVPHPGLIDDRRFDAGHSGLIGKAVECKVLQMLHITGDDMNYKIPASGN